MNENTLLNSTQHHANSLNEEFLLFLAIKVLINQQQTHIVNLKSYYIR